jgi:lipoate-protein ligase B
LNVGTMRYDACLALQTGLHARAVAEGRAFLVLVEHPPVVTFGKHADPKNALFSKAALASQGVDTADTDRGGDVTAHEPGQLVVYPILRLADFGLGTRPYVTLLENAMISTLARFGRTAGTDPENPGVWIGRDKIGAIGIRIRERATLHGLALNVNNDLATFGRIIACGLRGRGVTTLARQLGRPVSVDEVAGPLVEELLKGLGVPASGASGKPPCQGPTWPL